MGGFCSLDYDVEIADDMHTKQYATKFQSLRVELPLGSSVEGQRISGESPETGCDCEAQNEALCEPPFASCNQGAHCELFSFSRTGRAICNDRSLTSRKSGKHLERLIGWSTLKGAKGLLNSKLSNVQKLSAIPIRSPNLRRVELIGNAVTYQTNRTGSSSYENLQKLS